MSTLIFFRGPDGGPPIPIPPPAVEALEKQFAETGPEGLVWTTSRDTPLQHNLRRDLAKIGREAGLKKRVHPHTLRHTYAAAVLSAGIPIVKLCRWLGHTDIRTTYMYYGHLQAGDRDKIDQI